MNEMMYTGLLPYLMMNGIQIRFPVPCNKAVVVKKYAIFAIAAENVGMGGATPVKSIVISTMATVGPAAKKLQKNMARHTSNARYILYPLDLFEAVSPFYNCKQ